MSELNLLAIDPDLFLSSVLGSSMLHVGMKVGELGKFKKQNSSEAGEIV